MEQNYRWMKTPIEDIPFWESTSPVLRPRRAKMRGSNRTDGRGEIAPFTDIPCKCGSEKILAA
jgi:hypothetical protein